MRCTAGPLGLILSATLLAAFSRTAVSADTPRSLPAELPASLRAVDLEEMLAWMGQPLGPWQESHRSPGPKVSRALLQLPTRVAALGLAQDALRPAELAQLELSFNPRAGIPPPAPEWIVWEVYRRRYLDFESVRWIRLGTATAEVRGFHVSEDDAGISTCSLPLAEARWLAETLWWLTQLRLQRRPDSTFPARVFTTHHPDGRLFLAGRKTRGGAANPLEVHENLGNGSLLEGTPTALIVGLCGTLIEAVVGPGPAANYGPHRTEELRRALNAALAEPDPWPLAALRVLTTAAQKEELPALRTKAARSQLLRPSGRGAQTDFEAFLVEQRKRRDVRRLERIATSAKCADWERREAIAQLAAFAAPRAERVFERVLRTRTEFDRIEWRSLDPFPGPVRAALLQRLAQDASLPESRRSEAEYRRLSYTLGETIDEGQISAFLLNPSHPGSLRAELAQSLDQEGVRPGAVLRGALLEIAAEAGQDGMLRASAALLLGAQEDPRALPWLAELAGVTAGYDRGWSARPRTLGALAAVAPEEARRVASDALRGRIRGALHLPDVAMGAWLADFRELASELVPFATTAAGNGTTVSADGRAISCAAARAVVLAWREPDPLTRAQLGAILACQLRHANPAELTAFRRRLAALLEPLTPTDRTALADFVADLLERLRAAGEAPDEPILRELRLPL